MRHLIPFLLAILTTAHADTLPTWRHGTVHPKGDAGFLYLAADGGFGTQAGLDIKMVALNADTLLLKSLVAGELDSYEGNPGAALIAASKGADVKIIGCNWPGQTYSMYARPGITSLADLRGKTIAIVSPGALPDLFTRSVLRSAGLTAADVTLAPSGNFLPTLLAHVVDATSATSEYEPEAHRLGLVVLANGLTATPQFLRLCMMMTGANLRAKADDAAKFLSAEMHAYRYALDHRDEVIALSRKIANPPAGNTGAEAIYDQVKQFNAISLDFAIDPAKLDWLRDLLADTGSLPRSFDPSTMIADGPRQAALSR